MKINLYEPCFGVQLKTLKNGDCFLYDQMLYIKTNTEKQQPDPDFIKIMVVDLEDGIVELFCPNTIVIPIDAEINANGN